MGLETKTAAKQGRKKFDGKLYLDSKFLTFKSKELKWSAELGKATKASYKNDTLVVVCGKEDPQRRQQALVTITHDP